MLRRVIVFVGLCMGLGCAPAEEAGPPYLHQNPVAPRPLAQGAIVAPWTQGGALAAHGDLLALVDAANEDLVIVDRRTSQVARRLHLGGGPAQVVVGPDGVAFVTLRRRGAVVRVDLASGGALLTREVGDEPLGLALSPEADALYVALRAEGSVVALDPVGLDLLDRVDGLGRPTALVALPGGQIVATSPGQSVVVVTTSKDPSLAFDPASVEVAPLRAANPTEATLAFPRPAPNMSMALALTVHPERGLALVSHQLAFTGSPAAVRTTASGAPGIECEGEGCVKANVTGQHYYGGKTSAPAVINATDTVQKMRADFEQPIETTVTAVGLKATSSNSLPVLDPRTHAPMTHQLAVPSDIRHHPTWTMAFVVGAGSDNLMVLNTRLSDPMASPVALIDVGRSPRGVAFSEDGLLAYVLNADSFTLSVVDLSPLMRAPIPQWIVAGPEDEVGLPRMGALHLSHDREITYGDDPLPEDARLGRRAFNFARFPGVSQGGRFACLSCHWEGGEDGLTWFTPDGPRQTPALAGRLEGTAPFSWQGTEPTLTGNMSATIARLGGKGVSPQALDAMGRFLVGLDAPDNPHRAAGALTDQQRRGQALFMDAEVGCVSCHPGEATTDGLTHDVGTATREERALASAARAQRLDGRLYERFDTPSLKGLFSTAPYLHDGSASTLMEVLNRTATTMGRTDHLSQDQKADLIAYLLTL